MKLKDKLKLIEEIEKRNQTRIMAFISKKQQDVSSASPEKTTGNRDTPKKSR